MIELEEMSASEIAIEFNFSVAATIRVVTPICDEQLIDDDCISSGCFYFFFQNEHKLGNGSSRLWNDVTIS